jgi:hypothetical protein
MRKKYAEFFQNKVLKELRITGLLPPPQKKCRRTGRARD